MVNYENDLIFFAAILLLTLYSCQRDDRPQNDVEDAQVNADKETPLNLIEYLVGEWEMVGSEEGAEGSKAPGERLIFTYGGAAYTYRRIGPASIPPDKTRDAPLTE